MLENKGYKAGSINETRMDSEFYRNSEFYKNDYCIKSSFVYFPCTTITVIFTTIFAYDLLCY